MKLLGGAILDVWWSLVIEVEAVLPSLLLARVAVLELDDPSGRESLTPLEGNLTDRDLPRPVLGFGVVSARGGATW